ncbi:hypothetical protein [Amycolatopsis minnesotensis]|uniref:hypothetical protein n=1 Tax=Amycolatopsis minnesotensis TaxID=337894 RepID=UPI0031DC344F
MTAVVAGAFTLAASWLAGKLSLKRLRLELEHSRALERDKETHSRSLERDKELYNRRVDFYLDLVPLIDQIMEELPPTEKGVKQDYRDCALLDQDKTDVIKNHVKPLQKLFRQTHVISGKNVRALLGQFLCELQRVIDGDQGILTEVAWAANHLIWELRLETGVTTRDDDEEFELRSIYYPNHWRAYDPARLSPSQRGGQDT